MALLQESLKALLGMRRNSKEKELEALLAGDHDSCSCYIEVTLPHSSNALTFYVLWYLILFFCHFLMTIFKLVILCPSES